MPKDEVKHFRFGTSFNDRIACSYLLAIENVLWTKDWKDVTCDNCLRTRKYKEAKSGTTSN